MRLPVNRAVPLVLIALLAGCGIGGGRPAEMAAPARVGPAADYPMVIGEPYVVGTTSYAPADRMNYDAVGYASVGQAGGEGVSLAHHELPLPSYVEVTSLETGRTILVRVERRGPMDSNRLVELSPGAAAQLGANAADMVPVRVRRVNPPEPERAALRAGQRAPERMETPRSLVNVLTRRLDPPLPGTTPAPASGAMPTSAPTTPATPATRPLPPQAQPTPAPAPAPTTTAAPPAPRPVATPATTPPAPRPAPTAAPAPATAGTLVVQAGAFSNRQRADEVASRLGGQVSPAGRLWRVRMGPFRTRAEADAALAKARSAGYTDARIQNVR